MSELKKDPMSHGKAQRDTIAEHIEELGIDHEEEKFVWTWNVILNVLALYMTYLAATWSYAIPGSSVAFITKEFPVNPALTIWIATLPSISLCCLQSWLSELSDIFGRRWFLLVGSVFGFVGMMLNARCSNVEMVVGGQVFAGIGCTLNYLSTPLLAELVPKRQRGFVLGATVVVASLSLLAGVMMQGAFMNAELLGTNRSWRIGMYIGAAINGIALIMVYCLYHPGKRPASELSVWTRIMSIDWVGIFLWTAGLLLFLIGLQFGGNPDPWQSIRVLSMLIIGIFVIVCFGIWEWKFVDHGLFDRDLFKHRNFASTLVLNFMEGLVATTTAAFFTQETLNIFTTDFLRAQVLGLGSTFGSMFGAIITAAIVYRTKDAKWFVVVACVFLVLAPALFTIITANAHIAAFIIPSMLSGAGAGMLGITIPLIASLSTPDRLIATSIGLGTSIRGLGGSLGPTIFAQVFASKLKVAIPKLTATSIIKAGLPIASVPQYLAVALSGKFEELQSVPGSSPAVLAAFRDGLQQAYAIGFRYLWISVIPFAVITMFGSLYLTSTKNQMTNEVASAVQERKAHGIKDLKRVSTE